MALPFENADPLGLYRYFPTFVKLRDEEAGTDSNGETILQRITYMLEKEAGAHVEMLRGIIDGIDPDHCDASLLNHLSFILGVPIPGGWGDERKREFLRQLPGLIRIKGTQLHFLKKASFAGYAGIFPVELWKTIPREDRSYERESSPPNVLKAARIDLMSCSASCEQYCEVSCEYAIKVDGNYVPAGIAEGVLEEIGEVLPIHVVLRRDVQVVEPDDGFFPSMATLGCHDCEIYCEASCEAAAQSWPGSYLESNFEDEFTLPKDSYVIDMDCITACESSCQTCCECGQEGTCETLCETACQVVCEAVCQSACMTACQGSCQATCQGTYE